MISPEIQKSAINNWARQNGRRIIGWVDDLDDTGRNFKRKITKAIDRIEIGEGSEIVVYRYDRWGRNAVESLANVHRVESVGGSVVSATEPLDPETAIGRYNRTNAFGLAELQSDIISDNWKAVMANRVSRQLTPSGSPRFGYRRVGRIPDALHNPSSRVRRRYRIDPEDPDERYEPDPETARMLTEMYGRYISGWGYGRIAIWLNECGVHNSRGAPWSDVTVRNVLDAGFGAGFLQVHAGHCKCRSRGSCRNRVRVAFAATCTGANAGTTTGTATARSHAGQWSRQRSATRSPSGPRSVKRIPSGSPVAPRAPRPKPSVCARNASSPIPTLRCAALLCRRQ